MKRMFLVLVISAVLPIAAMAQAPAAKPAAPAAAGQTGLLLRPLPRRP